MWKAKWSRLTECLARPQGFVLLLLPGLLGFSLYFLSGNERDYEKFQYLAWRSYNTSVEVVEGYLVWNPKCHMLSMNPYDPSITKYVKREKFESCSSGPRLTSIARELNGSVYLTINKNVAKHHKGLSCCWALISRPVPGNTIVTDKEFDSKINIGECEYFEDHVLLPKTVETLLVTCKTSKPGKPSKGKVKSSLKSAKNGMFYENIHVVLNPERVRDRLNTSEIRGNGSSNVPANKKALSVFMLGIDSVSRLNFYRTMPNTRHFFEDRGWIELRGYNKMGDNTFPNLMAFFTGQNSSTAFDKCKPRILYGMDNCSMIWYNFRDIGYVTAYAEDHVSISTWNYMKVGFVEPPTDYYARPYVLAMEKFLKGKQRYSSKYCSGPELTVDRIYDYGVEFSKTFIGAPYFGFFWTNGISHENMNGPSLYDSRFSAKLLDMESAGVMNDSMIVVLSDHGMRYGDIRSTFVGWYEERLPFIYIWLPEWFREQYPEAYHALRINQNRLTSPFDLYETFRDILSRAGGQALPSSGCLSCSTLFKPVPHERGCKDAGITSHWCTCAAFEPASTADKIVAEGAQKFVEHMNNIVKRYKTKKGNRLCAQLKLKRIIRVKKLLDLDQDPKAMVLKFFYLLETSPGDGKFETTISYHGSGNYTIRDEEVSRINTYYHSARCLDEGYKQYCHCSVWSSISDHLFGR